MTLNAHIEGGVFADDSGKRKKKEERKGKYKVYLLLLNAIFNSGKKGLRMEKE